MLLFYFCTAKIILIFCRLMPSPSPSRALRAAAVAIECFHVRCIARLRVDDPTQLRWRLLLAELTPARGGGGGDGAAVEAIAVGVRARESLRLLLLPLAGEGIGLETLLLSRLRVRRIA
jgi:hypothetical protein